MYSSRKTENLPAQIEGALFRLNFAPSDVSEVMQLITNKLKIIQEREETRKKELMVWNGCNSNSMKKNDNVIRILKGWTVRWKFGEVGKW